MLSAHALETHDQRRSTTTTCSGWGCTVAAYPHAIPTLPVTVELIRLVHPVPATATLACVRLENMWALNARLSQWRLPLRLKPTAQRDPWDTWQHRIPQRGGRVWSHSTHGSARALLYEELGSKAVGCVPASEPFSAGRRDLKSQVTW
jgi:hypothetical protein